jgi:SAM-dependent methyltransferase
LYAALHVGTPGDVEFYLRACQGARKVLEYGCGAGRIAIELAERGHTVIGVDLDAALLQLARERKSAREAQLGRALPVEFVEGDMTMFSKRGCDRVIIPYSALWCLIGTDAKRKCLAKARASLGRDGQLVFDVYDADVMSDDTMSDDQTLDDDATEDDAASRANGDASAIEQDDYEELHRVKLEDVTYRVWERNTWDPIARLMQVGYRLHRVPSRKMSDAKRESVADKSKRGTAPGSNVERKRGAASKSAAQSVATIKSKASSEVTAHLAAEAALRRNLAPRRTLAAEGVSRADEHTSPAKHEGFYLSLSHSVLWRHELAELLDDCGFEVEWGVDEAGEDTPFAEQVVVRAVRA